MSNKHQTHIFKILVDILLILCGASLTKSIGKRRDAEQAANIARWRREGAALGIRQQQQKHEGSNK